MLCTNCISFRDIWRYLTEKYKVVKTIGVLTMSEYTSGKGFSENETLLCSHSFLKKELSVFFASQSFLAQLRCCFVWGMEIGG